MLNDSNLEPRYRALKRLGAKDLKGIEVGSALLEMAREGYTYLWTACSPIAQSTKVTGKTYLAFEHDRLISRPINSTLYVQDKAAIQLAEQFIMSPESLNGSDATRAAYTIAVSVMAANDVLDIGRKASATFFEILIGHMIAKAFGMNPRKKVAMPENAKVLLPTDYVFDLGQDLPKIHLPVKTSTRERIVQAWVHQLILDRIFGAHAYRGMLVCVAETKRSKKQNAVIEICIPNQLKLYQARLAEMHRIYYLDPPKAYLDLSTSRPTPVEVRPFGEFFAEVKSLMAF